MPTDSFAPVDLYPFRLRATSYRGAGFKVPDLPHDSLIRLADDCGHTKSLLGNFSEAMKKIEYGGLRETGLELIESVERIDPPFDTLLDADLPRSRRQILAEAVLLFGLDAVCRREIVPCPDIKFVWDISEENFTFSRRCDGGSVEGRALFISAFPCADRRPVLRDAFVGLPNADFQIAIANSCSDEDHCAPALAVNQFLILVNLADGRHRLYGNAGLVL